MRGVNQKQFRKIICLIFLSAFTLLLSHVAFAIGEGDGGGGGPSVPLEMDWSFPANGETGVSIYTVIQCKFSHNVAHFDVAPRNAGKFLLTREDGTQVEAEVYQVDAEMEFDKRQYVYLYPKNELEEYTTYIVTAEEGVQAKNGMATEQTQSFRFTTGSRNAVSVAVATPKPTKSIRQDKEISKPEPQTAKESTSESMMGTNTDTQPTAAKTEMQKNVGSTVEMSETEFLPRVFPLLAAVMGLVLVTSFCLTWYRKRGD